MDYYNNDQGNSEWNGENGKKSFRLWFILGALGILLIVLIIGGILLISANTKSDKYNSYIKAGNQFYYAGNYEEAVLNYQQALKIDPDNSGAYINLSYAYVALGDFDSAVAILNNGISLLGTDDFQAQLLYVQNISASKTENETSNLSSEEIEILSQEVTIENSRFDMVASYTYTEYFRDFGEPASKESLDDQLVLQYNSPLFYATYYNFSNEIVLDNSGQKPIATAKPCEIRFGDISTVFGSSEEIYVVSKEKLIEFFGENLEFYQDNNTKKYYVKAEYKGCQIIVETDLNGNIISKSAWNQFKPLQRGNLVSEEEESEVGKISGYIQNATTGNGINAVIKIRERGVKNGTPLSQLQSSADGSYYYEGAAGKYTFEVSQPGFVTEYVDIEIIKGQIKTGVNIVITPEVAEGEIRIVLTWGDYPMDLDSHTDGYASNGNSFHINYNNKNISNIGMLDVDDMNGFGPETTTIMDGRASFTFSVVDYHSTGCISTSQAVVKVYLPGQQQPVTYTVPSASGNTWNVFRYENGNIVPINTVE